MEQVDAQPGAPPGERPARQAIGRPLLLVLDREEQVSLAEGAGWSLLGERPGTLTGSPLAEALSRWPAMLAHVRRALSGTSSRLEMDVDGARLEVAFWPRQADDGAILGVVLSGQIFPLGPPPRVPVRRELPFLRLLFRQVPGALWATNTSLRLTFGIGRLVEVEGHPIRAREGQSLQDLIAERDPEHPLVLAHRAALEGEGRSFSCELKGRSYDLEVRPLRDRTGALVGCVGVGLDVTDHRRTEHRRILGAAQLEEAQRLAHVGSWEWDLASGTSHWSGEMYRLLGLDPAGPPPSLDAALRQIHPDDAPRVRDTLLQALATAGPFSVEGRVVRSDGSVRMLHTRGDSVRGPDGQRHRLAGTCWDMTDLWKTQQAEQRTLSLLEATLDATADGIVAVDPAGRIVSFNRRFIEIWNIPEALAREPRYDQLLEYARTQVEAPEHFSARVAAVRAAAECNDFDVLVLRDGRVVERHSRPQWIDGHAVGRVWSFRDVTQREQLLARTLLLADASRLLASLDVEAALPGIAQLAVRSVADACAVDLETPTGPRRAAQAAHRPEALELLPALRTEAAEPAHAIHRVQTIPGGEVVQLPLRTIAGALGTLTLALAHPRHFIPAKHSLVVDLAQRISISLELARSFRRLEEAADARDELLGIAAHEIRGPVTSIHLAVQQLKSLELPNELRRRLQSLIEREDTRLGRFVEELLEVGRVRSGALRLQRSRMDLVLLARAAIAQLGDEIARTGSRISLLAPAEIVGQWDVPKVELVLFHLLANALKFGRGRPIDLTVSVQDGRALLAIVDEGVGIAPDAQADIFDPFMRAVSPRNYGGLGLGLYITRTLVELMGGTIQLESEPDRGTKVHVELPILERP